MPSQAGLSHCVPAFPRDLDCTARWYCWGSRKDVTDLMQGYCKGCWELLLVLLLCCCPPVDDKRAYRNCSGFKCVLVGQPQFVPGVPGQLRYWDLPSYGTVEIGSKPSSPHFEILGIFLAMGVSSWPRFIIQFTRNTLSIVTNQGFLCFPSFEGCISPIQL